MNDAPETRTNTERGNGAAPAWREPSAPLIWKAPLSGGNSALGIEWREPEAAEPDYPPYPLPGSEAYRAAEACVSPERREAARRYIERMAERAGALPSPAPKLDKRIKWAAPWPVGRKADGGWKNPGKKIPVDYYKPGARPRAFTAAECGNRLE